MYIFCIQIVLYMCTGIGYLTFVKWIVCVCDGEQNQAIFSILQLSSTPEAEFLDAIGTKVLGVFLIAIQSPLLKDFTPLPTTIPP
jgi:hypothetical protein